MFIKVTFAAAKDEMVCLEELEAAKKEVEQVTGEKPISQKMFRTILYKGDTGRDLGCRNTI